MACEISGDDNSSQLQSPKKRGYFYPKGYLAVQLPNELGSLSHYQLQRELRKSRDLMQRLRLGCSLKLHTGCVNTVDWSSDGRYLTSGSDDLHLAIWDTVPRGGAPPFRFKTSHPDNIFSAKFLHDDENRNIVSASGDGLVVHSRIAEAGVAQKLYRCHSGTVYRVCALSDPSSFMTCSEDGTVRLFDHRQPFSECDKSVSSCNHSLLVNMEKSVSSLALNPARTFEFAAGCSDSTITFYDRRNMTTPLNQIRCQTTKNMPRRITSLQYDIFGTSILANVLCEKIQLLDLSVSQQLKEGRAKKLQDPRETFPSEPLPIKRLRLRGDWSDTGPQSRPGSRPAEQASGSSRFMVEISDLMTTWMRNQISTPPSTSGSASLPVRTPLVQATDRSGGGGRNDSGIEDLLASAASRTKKLPENLVVLKPVLEYSGHRSSRTMIKEASFWDDSYIISGSDCGRIFIWDRYSGELVNILDGDQHVVNCIRPHPTDFTLATSGIEHDVKVWTPTAPESTFDKEEARNIVEVNNQMLDETRDTVTVPALCVVRILRAMARRSQEGEQRRQARQEREGEQNAGGEADADSTDDE